MKIMKEEILDFLMVKLKEKFKTGDAMIFPAEPIWIHGTEPITKGVRYSVNCFLQSMKLIYQIPECLEKLYKYLYQTLDKLHK
jgi:predicted 2-oxoglutarate/Fe(II)-dependent dioxygenase YbiX